MVRNIYYPNNVNLYQNTLTPLKKIQFTGTQTKSDESSEIKRIAAQISETQLDKHLNKLAGAKTEGRAVGEKGIEIAKKYIAQKFKEYGLEPAKILGLRNYFETFTMPKYPLLSDKKGDYTYGSLCRLLSLGDVKTSNVLGMIKGTEKPDEYVIISGHYDHLGKDAQNNIVYPGANDDVSGISAMLEIARIMSKEKPPKKTVIFAALSGEESGCHGANKLGNDIINKHFDPSKVEVLNLEMLGATGGNKLDIWDQDSDKAKNIVDKIVKAGDSLNIKTNVFHRPDPGSDARKFNSFGMPAVCVAWDFDMGNNHPTYHCAEDTSANVNKEIFHKASKLVAAASYLLANSSAENNLAFTANKDKRVLELDAYKQRALNLRKIV